jgi:hypothetical protein
VNKDNAQGIITFVDQDLLDQVNVYISTDGKEFTKEIDVETPERYQDYTIYVGHKNEGYLRIELIEDISNASLKVVTNISKVEDDSN